MAEFILNPRRAPRAPARCKAAVSSTQGWFEAETEDIGSMGCQLVAPKLVRKGELVQLHVTNPKVSEPLRIAGRVAWVSAQAPWRLGIAFDDGGRAASARWFDLLIAGYPGLGGYRRVPDRIRADETVYLGPPPKFLLDFNGEEAMLLRVIGSGARLDELMVRLRDRWPAAQRALFSLIARQAVTFQRGQAVHPDSWKKILHEVEASLALEELGKDPATPLRAPPVPRVEPLPLQTATRTPVPMPPGWAPPAARQAAVPASRAASRRAADVGWATEEPPVHDPSPVLELRDEGAAPLEIAAPGVAASWGSRTPPPADFEGAGGGWRKAHQRSPEASAAFERALAELQAGSVNGAIALLRRALALAPGDPEIAAALGKLAFKDRQST